MENLEKLHELIDTENDINLKLAAQIVKGNGLPPKLIPKIFEIYAFSENKEVRRSCREMLKANVSSELTAIIKKNWKIGLSYNWNYKDLQKVLGRIRECRTCPELDIAKLAYRLLKTAKAIFDVNSLEPNCLDMIYHYAKDIHFLEEVVKEYCLESKEEEINFHFRYPYIPDFVGNFSSTTFFSFCDKGQSY